MCKLLVIGTHPILSLMHLTEVGPAKFILLSYKFSYFLEACVIDSLKGKSQFAYHFSKQSSVPARRNLFPFPSLSPDQRSVWTLQ